MKRTELQRWCSFANSWVLTENTTYVVPQSNDPTNSPCLFSSTVFVAFDGLDFVSALADEVDDVEDEELKNLDILRMPDIALSLGIAFTRPG